MGRTRKLRGGQGVGEKRSRQQFESSISTNSCADSVDESWMAYHLKADIKHDFGDIELIEATSEDMITGNTPPWSLKENDVMTNFLEKFEPGKNDIRKRNKIDFKLSEKTDLFPQQGIDTIFNPFNGVSASEIGVLQDAGFQLYRAMGAINLITFGSILDQAGKPRENAYIFPSTSTLTFPLCTFGFNPDNIGNITLSNFTGNSVECKFETKFENGGSGGPILLNKNQGDFQSIAEVKKLQNNAKKRGIIGKALGDALQVISLVPKIGTIANSLCPLNQVKSLENPENIVPMKKVIFNTGDRLAHARAYAFGVPSVYSAPSKKGIREFEYIPGIDFKLTKDDLNRYYATLIGELTSYVEKVYNDLINHLSTEVLKGGKFDVNMSKKSGQNMITRNIDYATILIKLLITNIGKIRDNVKKYCESFASRKDTQKAYIDLLKECVELVPASVSTLTKNGRDISLIVSILKTSKNIGDIPAGSYTFYVTEVYQLIQSGSQLTPRLSNIFTMFEGKLPSRDTVGGQLKQEITVFGESFTSPTIPDAPMDKKDVSDKSETYLISAASDMTINEVFQAYETYKKYPQSILDKTLLESLINEYIAFSGSDDKPVELKLENTNTVTHTKSSLKFNAFACKFNATIAGEDTELGKELKEYATKFEELAKPSDPGTSTPPRPPQPPAGTMATLAFSSQSQIPAPTGSMLPSVFGSPMSAVKKEEDGSQSDTNESGKQSTGKKLEFGSGIYRSDDLDGTHGGGLDMEHSFVKKIGGQRVDRENFSIDETKSFVRVGGYPSSNVK